MAVNISVPQRTTPIVKGDGSPNLRTAAFFDSIAEGFAGLPDEGAAVADLAGGASLADVIAKVNELLAVLRTAGVIDT